MSQPGWIKIHRALLDHWSSSEPEAMAVWIRMLCEANFEEKTTLIHGQLVTVKRGQLIFGLEKFSARSGVSIKKLRRIVDMLVSDGMLGRQVMQRFSMLTITCYDKYQDAGKQEAGTGQAEGNRGATPKEGNKSISGEGKKNTVSPSLDYSCWPSMPNDELMEEWKSLRKRKRAAISQTVINRVGKELNKAASSGFTVDQCFEQWVYKGWSGFEAEWMTGGSNQPKEPVKPIKPRDFGA